MDCVGLAQNNRPADGNRSPLKLDPRYIKSGHVHAEVFYNLLTQLFWRFTVNVLRRNPSFSKTTCHMFGVLQANAITNRF